MFDVNRTVNILLLKKSYNINFIICRCGPCQIIAPIFEQLSVKYSNAVFLKVDVDKCAETAAKQGVSAMPTFIFYRNQTKLGLCQGADPVGLESKILQFYDSGDTEDSESPVSGHVRNSDIYYHIFGIIFLAAILYFWNVYLPMKLWSPSFSGH